MGKRTAGGKYAWNPNRNILRLDTSGLEHMIRTLESLGGNVRQAVEESLVQAAEKVREDTIEALQPQYLPAGGIYSRGKTLESVITDTRVTWEGTVGSVPIGFDFSKSGAGGFLITGTPRMQPDRELNRMYKGKKYMADIQKQMSDVIIRHIIDKMSEG